MMGMGTASSAIARQKPKDACWQASFEKTAKEHKDGATVANDLHETRKRYDHTSGTTRNHLRHAGHVQSSPWGAKGHDQ